MAQARSVAGRACGVSLKFDDSYGLPKAFV